MTGVKFRKPAPCKVTSRSSEVRQATTYLLRISLSGIYRDLILQLAAMKQPVVWIEGGDDE